MDKNPAYPPAIEQLKDEKSLSKETIIRQAKYLNNIIEQDHRFIKKITNHILGFIVPEIPYHLTDNKMISAS
ncbi:MAG: Integrase catalytic region [Bacilli bacterium]|nr:Integrase catalytic region [Bacilli bacterium]